ncbi:MAG: nucleotidyltransferase domain-containing protein [Sedimentisphaerales bacterium]|jgi:predicted nucleotidyltransferase
MAERGKPVTGIDDAVRRIVDQFHPAKIILFGSHARGSAGADSDVDLLVVMDVEGSKRRRAVEIDLVLSNRTFPLDLIVITPEEFETYRDIMGHILYPAVREGKVLYDAA